MLLLRFTILFILSVVASQNHDVNSKTPYRKVIRQRSVEAATPIPPDPRVDDEGLELLLTRLETLCVEKLENLITDTNKRFQSLEYQSSEVHSTVDFIRDALGHINDPLTRLENLLLQKLDNLTTEIGLMSQCCSGPAYLVVPINESLENLNKDIQLLMNASRILSSNVEAVQRYLINDTRYEFFQTKVKQNTLQTVTSTPLRLNCSLDKQCPKNCKEVRESGRYASGIYMLQPEGAPKPFEAVCDLETRGGNWTVIQRRIHGSQDFFLDWQDYKNGFGNLTGEFWLGLEHIHFLTGYEENELLVEVGDGITDYKTALYSQFCVGSEIEGYPLKKVGTYAGDAGDSLKYHDGSRFYTKDVDDTTGVAKLYEGAWWYKDGAALSNLNGKFLEPGLENRCNRIFWYYFSNNCYNLKYTRMLVRPKV